MERCLEVYETGYRGDFSGDTGYDNAICEIALINGDKRAPELLERAADYITTFQKIPLAQLRASCFKGLAAMMRIWRPALEFMPRSLLIRGSCNTTSVPVLRTGFLAFLRQLSKNTTRLRNSSRMLDCCASRPVLNRGLR